MRLLFALASGAACAALLAGPALAGVSSDRHKVHRHSQLPPVTGTIRLDEGAFGPRRAYRPGFTFQHRVADQAKSSRQRPRTIEVESAGMDSFGLAGSNRRPYAGITTAWGTADSATTGGTYPLPNARTGDASAVHVVYGEPLVDSSPYPMPPTGGLSYYNSGSPGRMAYYGSSSSAGPYGTPGGLGIYSSGSYGPGPRIIHVDGRRAAWGYASAGCACGPHIIHVSHGRRDRGVW